MPEKAKKEIMKNVMILFIFRKKESNDDITIPENKPERKLFLSNNMLINCDILTAKGKMESMN